MRSGDKALLTGEIGHPALGHGPDALLEIGGFAQPALLGELVFGRLGDAVGKAGPQGRPGGGDAQRCILGDLGRERQRWMARSSLHCRESR